MKIAMVAPLMESVPPKLYGGTERVVSYLTEELVCQGHDVTLFASGDSLTKAKLIPIAPTALRLSGTCIDPIAWNTLAVEKVAQMAYDFDIIHFHIDYLQFPLFRRLEIPTVTTMHGRLDIPDIKHLLSEFRDMPYVSISMSQRRPLPFLHWVGNVYHGLPPQVDTFPEREPEPYLAFLGRISPEKRLDTAIEIARRAGTKIKVAAKIDPANRDYFEMDIQPLFQEPFVEYIGEIGDDEKGAFLGSALAMLFPISWPEPFGLVVIEALACGTPVVAFPCGSVPEIVEHGKNGFIVENIEQAVAAVHDIAAIDRQYCQRSFQERFSVERMAREYIAIYERVIEGEMELPLAVKGA